jgi:hypothetical protein
LLRFAAFCCVLLRFAAFLGSMPDAGLGAPSALQVRAPELDDITPNATCVKMTHPISSKPPKKDTEWQKNTKQRKLTWIS